MIISMIVSMIIMIIMIITDIMIIMIIIIIMVIITSIMVKVPGWLHRLAFWMALFSFSRYQQVFEQVVLVPNNCYDL